MRKETWKRRKAVLGATAALAGVGVFFAGSVVARPRPLRPVEQAVLQFDPFGGDGGSSGGDTLGIRGHITQDDVSNPQDIRDPYVPPDRSPYQP